MKENLMEESNNRTVAFWQVYDWVQASVSANSTIADVSAGKMALTDFTSLPKYSMLRKAFGTCFQKQ